MKFFENIFKKQERIEDKLRQRILDEPSVKRTIDDLITNPELPELKIYMVGGIVRDSFLDRPSKDYDFVLGKITQAQLEKALTKEKGSLDLTGKNFGVNKFMPADSTLTEAMDFAFPRTEMSTGGGGKRDFEVQYDPNLPIETDLSRRDLTINAMAFDAREGKLIDPFGGRKDLENKIIRAVGDPNERFKEDYSRILRAIRVACQLDFRIEPKTWQAIVENAKHLNDTRTNNEGQTERVVPEDTIRKEMLKALETNPSLAFELFDKAGVFEQIIPEIDKLKGCEQPPEHHYEGDVIEHTKLMIEKINSPEFKAQFPEAKIDGSFIMAVLLHDVGKPATKKEIEKDGKKKIVFYGHENVGAKMSETILRKLRFSRKQVERVKFLIENHMIATAGDPATLKATTIEKYFMGSRGQRLMMLHYLDALGSLRPDGSPSTDKFKALIKRMEKIKATLAARIDTPVELLNGGEIMELFEGKKGGPWISEIKKRLREEQLSDKISSKEEAAAFIQAHRKDFLDL
ncbi:MAG TPA: HD domain-containing protein [Candidatus Bipolaricaulota bacterium]|nr:HD domain-containing protein [Candidatus Bipolaricaulota bacterium]